eukprot:2245408-Lingulodinium_polyedra.AAC.1
MLHQGQSTESPTSTLREMRTISVDMQLLDLEPFPFMEHLQPQLGEGVGPTEALRLAPLKRLQPAPKGPLNGGKRSLNANGHLRQQLLQAEGDRRLPGVIGSQPRR